MYTKRGGVAAYHIVWIGLSLRSVPGVRDLAIAGASRVCVFLLLLCTSKNTHTRDAPQTQMGKNTIRFFRDNSLVSYLDTRTRLT